MTERSVKISVSASAPGKVVLAGEYAVLDGAPAICLAVDRRARVTIADNDAPYHAVSSAGRDGARGRFVAAEDTFEWLEGGDDFPLVKNVWQAANARVGEHLSLVLDTRAFSDTHTGIKIGIGSSAALATALSHALCEIAQTDAGATRIAFAAHRQFQQGLGSGVDVACSSLGGLVDYTMGGAMQRIAWPDGLHVALLWSGVPANTQQRLRHLAGREPQPSRAALVLAARRLAELWRGGSATAILDEYCTYNEVLREFSVDHDLGIFDAGHAQLVDAARQSGLVYKPCGSGGGDIGVALASDAGRIAEFVEQAQAMHFRPLDAGIDLRGPALGEEPI
jgi:phosphomevalonate kinase